MNIAKRAYLTRDTSWYRNINGHLYYFHLHHGTNIKSVNIWRNGELIHHFMK